MGAEASSSCYQPACPDLSDLDLSEFCIKPPSGLSPEQLKAFQDEQDAELARFLQQHEAKRSQSTARERQQLIEAQDQEIARVLQEQERAKAKRLREKARLKKQQNGGHAPDVPTGPRPPYPESSCSRDEITPDEITSDAQELAKRALPPLPNYHNVAIDLDPTYNPNEEKRHPLSPGSELGPDINGLHFAQLCRVSPSSSESSPSSSLRSKEVLYELDDTFLPVPGQRRPTGDHLKSKSKKKKDGCKTQ
jgi:hypothetical protein